MRTIVVTLALLLATACTGAPPASPALEPQPGTSPEASVAPATPPATSPATPPATLPSNALSGLGELRADTDRLPANAASDAELAALVASDTDFATRLYQQIVASEEGNVFLSPYSISTALSMAYAGAREETARQMAEALAVALEADAWHAARNRLELDMIDRAGEPLPSDWEGDRLTLDPTNAIFGQAGFPFRDGYLDKLASCYGAPLHTLDFASNPEGARTEINAWVAERTRERIKELLAEGTINSLTTAVLVNAIYFKGSWLHPFDAADTAPMPFHALDGSSIDVPMMHATLQTDYAAGDGWQAVRLPYIGASMLVVVPDSGRFADVESALDAELLADVRSRLGEFRVDLRLPKWESESALGLNQVLMDTGMTDAFDPDLADFNGIAPLREMGTNLFISDVVHQANVTVDEEGTEAAAATAVILQRVSARPEPPRVELTLDRPFIYLVQDDATGEILFIGRLLAP